MVVPHKILFINDWAKGRTYAGAQIATEYLAAAIKKTKILNPVEFYLPQPQHKNEVIKDGSSSAGCRYILADFKRVTFCDSLILHKNLTLGYLFLK